MSLIQTMINAEWLIEPDYLKKLCDIVSRDSAVETYAGVPLENTYRVEKRGDIAVIPVNGVIFRYANHFTQICGATSIEILAKDIQAAIDNPKVKGILLNIDSPGGQASGVGELSEIIYKARSIKPVKAYVGNLAASAAYFIAAACDEIIVDDMASLGSIGVVSMVSKRQDNETLEIVSTQSPNKRPDYGTEEGLKQIQARADALADVLITKVGKYRALSSGGVIEAGNRGGIRIGIDAVNNKLCDRLGSFEGVLKEMNEPKLQMAEIAAAKDMSNCQDTELRQEAVETKLAQQMAENQPDEKAKAVEQERMRVAEIMSLSVPGAEAVINEAITKGVSKGEAALKMVDFFKTREKSESLFVRPAGDEGEKENATERNVALIAAEINRNK